MRARLLLLALLALTLSSCKSADVQWIDWQWPMHVRENRAAWKEATGRDVQYRDGASSMFW